MTQVWSYDIAISCAGEDRPVVAPILDALGRMKLSVFYDDRERTNLWGQDLKATLEQVYGARSRFNLVFLSGAYLAKPWTLFELEVCRRRAAAMQDRSLLLVLFEPVTLPDGLGDYAYFDLRRSAHADIVEAIRRKFDLAVGVGQIDNRLESRQVEERAEAVQAILSLTDCKPYHDILQRLLLEDAAPSVRQAAAFAIDQLRLPAAIPALLAALSDSDWSTRSAAGWALVNLGEPARRAVQLEAPALRSADAREMAMLVLERIPKPLV